MNMDQLDQATPLGYEIIKLGHFALRQQSTELNTAVIGSERFNKFLSSMRETLKTAKGVGLAAPQVGVNLRLFLTQLPSHLESRYFDYTPSPFRVWINPSYTIVDDKMLGGLEGCLSVPCYSGRVLRPAAIKVKAIDENGKTISETLSGWNTRVFLHEYDHLDGTLYVDKLTENSAGQKDFYEGSMWQKLEEKKRESDDAEWLARFSLKIDPVDI